MRVLNERRGIIVVFAALLLVGIFFRTYHFHDWLRFNADQSRDATVVSGVLEHKDSLPLLGPKAGGTDFRLGPAFYYFQIASAKVFGNFPDKMAYPDLLFSLLTIPLLFLFLRKYFDNKTSLMLVGIFAVSAYAVKYSRFAWNPNSLPFWSILFLYGLHEIMVVKAEAWKWRALLVGVSLGIGVQLHTLSMLLFPVMALGTFGCLLYWRKKNAWKIILMVCFTALVLNAGQIVSEVKTGGDNTSAFFSGIGTKEKKGSGLVMNATKDVVCFSQGSAYMLSAYDSSDTCELKSITKSLNSVIFLFGLIVFIGGFILAVRAYRREENLDKKLFLGIFIFYSGLVFFLFLPLANEISMRFFLIILFMPFVLLGLWTRFLSEQFPKLGMLCTWIIVSTLIVANCFAVEKSFATYAAYLKNSDKGMDNVLLKEVELFSAYIISRESGIQAVAVDGDAQFLFKALKSMQYFTKQSGIKLVQKSKKTDSELPLYLIENTKQTEKILGNRQNVAHYASFGRFTIFSLKNE